MFICKEYKINLTIDHMFSHREFYSGRNPFGDRQNIYNYI